MEKLALDIIGLSYSQTQSGAYALVLGERNGNRRLPIIIGGFEAQAIAIELEKMTPSRPLTHDLLKSIAVGFDINVKEILVYNLVEGIFFAKLLCESNGKEIEIDARTSDAIAVAVRFNCPIYTHEFILATAGIILEDDNIDNINDEIDDVDEEALDDEVEGQEETDITKINSKKLEEMLQEAISNEDYERASQLRDELTSRSSN
ncbi:bifunctional nuclease family protein [Flavobacteriales bacterium]|jgi:bifunctional DNase/RNase|nr:bifunctional nuclease family protein [Flavobacteriales bacterium]